MNNAEELSCKPTLLSLLVEISVNIMRWSKYPSSSWSCLSVSPLGVLSGNTGGILSSCLAMETASSCTYIHVYTANTVKKLCVCIYMHTMVELKTFCPTVAVIIKGIKLMCRTILPYQVGPWSLTDNEVE